MHLSVAAARRMVSCAGLGFALLSLVTLGLQPSARAEPCSLHELMTLPMLDDTDPIVSIEMNGKARRVLIDTGGFWSLMNPRSVGELKPFVSPVMGRFGLSGVPLKEAVKVPMVRLGSIDIKNVDFMLEPPVDDGIDATLGANWLTAFDLEIDPGKKTVSLFSNEHCPGRVIHWLNSGVTTLPVKLNDDGHITLPIRLDGEKLEAVFDTGSSRTVLDARTAARLFDLNADSPGARPNADKTAFLYRFKTLDLGGFVLKDPVVEVAPIRNGELKLILGMSDISQIHFYLARGERRLYVTNPQGEAMNSQAQRMMDAVLKAQQASLNNANPGLVDYLNRAHQAGFRKDFNAASAALEAAMRIDPNSTYVYTTRAEIGLQKEDFDNALRDADTAVRLGSGNQDAYRARAEVYEKLGYPDRAIQDLTTAIKLKPGNALFYQSRSQLYEDSSDFARAADDMDAVLRLSPTNAWAIGRRCKLEAIMGKLDSARDICEAGLAIAPRDNAILDAKGYVDLRAGRYSDATDDFSDALKSFPNLATALYGRGLAERQRGDTKKADNDIAAAEAKVPDIAQRFDR
jgi:tetratricopeptide (TPR) repeat protein/predicted aspartyl protease